jgi:hypothetical protein
VRIGERPSQLRTGRLTLAAMAAGAALLPASAGAATLRAPATISLHGLLTAHATGLKPARYALYVGVTVSHPRGGQAIVCSAPVGRARRAAGRVTFSGRLPKFLGCRAGAGPLLGSVATKPGRYTLVFGVPLGHGTFDSATFFQRTLRVTP